MHLTLFGITCSREAAVWWMPGLGSRPIQAQGGTRSELPQVLVPPLWLFAEGRTRTQRSPGRRVDDGSEMSPAVTAAVDVGEIDAQRSFEPDPEPVSSYRPALNLTPAVMYRLSATTRTEGSLHPPSDTVPDVLEDPYGEVADAGLLTQLFRPPRYQHHRVGVVDLLPDRPQLALVF